MEFKIGLPEGPATNSRQLEKLQTYSLVNGMAIVAVLATIFEVLVPGLQLPLFGYTKAVQAVLPLPTVVIVLALIILTAPFHEGAHALLADKKRLVVGIAPKALVCYIAPYGTYRKSRAILICLLPFMLFTLIPYVVALVSKNPLIAYWSLMLAYGHALGCGGDLWICSRLLTLQGPNVTYQGYSSTEDGGGWTTAALGKGLT